MTLENPAISTTRLYRDASYAQEFDATIQAIDSDGDEATIILDQTLFYAEAGGQPSDRGFFYRDGVAVAEVVQVSNAHKHGDTILHRVRVLDGAHSLEAGSSLTGKIDWQRRYAHMQRHSAQHILSQSFLRSHVRLATVSVHLQHAECSIDFAGEPSQEEIAEAFALANAQGYARATIHTLTIDESEVAAYPLRRPPQVKGEIRLVYVGEDAKDAWEMSACGGTHVANVSEILPLHFLRSERVKGLTRVFFVCGWEALADYRLKHEVAYGLSNEFSGKVADVPARVHALREELASSKALTNKLQSQLAASLIMQWQQEAEILSGDEKLIVKQLEDNTLFKALGHHISESTGIIAFFVAPHKDKVQVLFVASEDVSHDIKPSFQAAMQVLEGKGGGKGSLLQGAGTAVSRIADALEMARATLIP